MAVVFSNNAATNLASNVSASATTISVVDGSVFPDVSGGHHTYLTLHDLNDNIEIVKLTARSGNTLTVDRGHDGTTGRSFVAGDKCELRITAVLLNEIASQADTDTNTTYTAGSGLDLSGTTFTNTSPDQTVSLTGSGATTISGTYPNFTISSTDNNTVYTHPSAHSISFITGLQTALNAKVDDSQVLTNVPSGAVFTDTVYTLPFTDNSSNWNTAYGWGNHASAGYLTSYTETDTLSSVTGRGATTSANISATSFSGNVYGATTGAPDSTIWGISRDQYPNYGIFYDEGNPDKILYKWAGATKFNINMETGALDTPSTITASGGNSGQWNTAYGWGDHGSAGYLTSHQSLSDYATETYVGTQITNLVDSSPAHLDTLGELATAIGNNASGVTALTNSIATKWTQDNTKISQWDTAYGWGNHASAGYLTNATLPAYPSVGNGTLTILPANSLTGSGTFTANQSGNTTISLGIDTPDDAGSGGWYDVVAWNNQLIKDSSVTIHGAGYLSAVYLNMSHNASTRNSDDVFYSSNDSYIRKNNAGGFRTSLDVYNKSEVNALIPTIPSSLPANGGNADTVDGMHGTDLLHYRGIVSGDWDTIFTTGTGKTNTSGLYQVHNLASGHSNHPTGVYTYGGVFAWQLTNSTFKLYSSHLGDLVFQSGWNNDENSGWRRILNDSYYGAAWTSNNDSSGSGLDADLLDGQHGSYYAPVSSIPTTLPANGGNADTVDNLHAASFIRNDVADSVTNYSNQTRWYSNTNMAVTSSYQSSLEVYSSGSGNDAFMAFHVGGDYATYLGLDGGTNKLSVGGWSMGAASYALYHEGNKPTLSELGYSAPSIGNGTLTINTSGSASGGGTFSANQSGNNTITITGTGITSYTETDTLNTVTGRGSTTSNNVDFGKVLVGGSYSNNAYSNVSSTRLLFGGGNDQDNYFIGTNLENYGGNYTKLDLRWHTGIRMGAQPSYGGVRIFNNEDLSSVLFSVGKGDGHTRVESGNLYFSGGTSNIAWHAGNDSSGSGLDADLLDGQHGSYYMPTSFLDSAKITFTVGGDADTYYPVSIQGGGSFAYQMYSISRHYAATAPSTWNTSSHKGGLTLTWQYSGDGFWGGNDHDIRIIKFDEIYSTMVTKMAGSVGGGGTNAGVVVWLRGGTASYTFHGPKGSTGDVNVHLTSVTASNGQVFAPMSYSSGDVTSTINIRYPVRNQTDLFVHNYGVWHSGNDSSGSGLDADLLDGQHGSYYAPASSIPSVGNGTLTINTSGSASGGGTFSANQSGNNTITINGTGITSYSETDTLASVTGRGASTSTKSTFSGGASITGTNHTRSIPTKWYGTAYSNQDIDYYEHNYAKAQLGNTYKYTTSRPAITTDSNYWVGTMGWSNIDLNTLFSYGSGFFDSWSGPSNAPSGTSHWQGINALHYSANTGNAQYGMQITMGAGNTNLMYVRGIWGGGFTSWQKMWNAGNDGSGSGMDSDTVDSRHLSEIVPFQSQSDFPDGTLVTTNINYGVASGDSWIIEATGKAYGGSRPHSIIAEGYIYNNTVINTNGSNIGGTNFTYLKVMNISGNLCFWWPRHSYWNSYDVHVRSSSGGTANYNRVTAIANSTDPSGATKKVQINLHKSWTAANHGSGSGLDADKLDSQEGSHYLDYNNFTNKPTIPTTLPANGGNADTVDGLHAASFARSDASDTIGNGVQWNWASTNTAGLKFTNSSYGKSLEIGGWTGTNTAGVSRIRNSNDNLHLDSGANGYIYLNHYSSGLVYANGHRVWSDGYQGTYNYNNLSNRPTIPTIPSSLPANGGNAEEAYHLDVRDSRSAMVTPDGEDDYRISAHFTDEIPNYGDWRSAITVKGWTDGYYAWQIHGPSSTGNGNSGLYYRDGKGSTWSSSYEIWHAGRDGSSSGLDADMTDGLHVHNTSGTQNSANQILRTQSNGYSMLGWIHTTSGSFTTAMDRIYCSDDGYIRYQTPSNFGANISQYINYNDLYNKPTIPVVGTANINIVAGTGLTGGGSFSANQSNNTTITLNATGSGGGSGTSEIKTATLSLTKAQIIANHGSGQGTILYGESGKIKIPLEAMFAVSGTGATSDQGSLVAFELRSFGGQNNTIAVFPQIHMRYTLSNGVRIWNRDVPLAVGREFQPNRDITVHLQNSSIPSGFAGSPFQKITIILKYMEFNTSDYAH